MSQSRSDYSPLYPKELDKGVLFKEGTKTGAVSDKEQIKSLFKHLYGQPILTIEEGSIASAPLKVGVVFSGGQAAGGHNVIAGLFDGLKALHKDCELIGFLGGPSGIVEHQFETLDRAKIDRVRNQGGFDLIGSGRTKIETEEQLQAALKVAQNLDGLVIIGGDDSNTNAAMMAEYFLQKGCSCSVVGVPKTIDGDLQNEHIEISFGFDTATKCYAQMISNIERDAISAKKYYHFIKLMGRSASHIALECALKTHPNYTIIGEEKKSLDEIVDALVEMIVKRSEMDHNYGVVLIPEGLIEFIPELKQLIGELNKVIDASDPISKLSGQARTCYEKLPQMIQQQLLLDRDPHGNVQVSHIQTEKLIVECVKKRMEGKTFNAVEHFFGYEGRCSYPSNFDANYCYALGRLATHLIRAKKTGYMAVMKELKKPALEWVAMGVPLTSMMNMEERKGKMKPVIRKALVDLNGEAYRAFVKMREEWMYEPCYQYVEPIQFWGPPEISDRAPELLNL